jgi:hypothetical protein
MPQCCLFVVESPVAGLVPCYCSSDDSRWGWDVLLCSEHSSCLLRFQLGPRFVAQGNESTGSGSPVRPTMGGQEQGGPTSSWRLEGRWPPTDIVRGMDCLAGTVEPCFSEVPSTREERQFHRSCQSRWISISSRFAFSC